MINIPVNKDVVIKLKQAGCYPDNIFTVYVVLYCMINGDHEFLNLLDDGNSSKRMVTVYYEMLRNGLLKEENEGGINFSLTQKGEDLFKSFELPASSKKPANIEVEEWFEKWLDLFPTGVKSGGKLLKSDKKGTLNKMKRFVKSYDYEPNLILKATATYLRERENDGWKFTKCATYFIDKKDEGSSLAEWCEMIKTKRQEVVRVTNTGLI